MFLARAMPMLAAGPIAGVLLDRLDRKRVMIASDLIRALIALGFILCIHQDEHAAAVCAERGVDVCFAIFHQRAHFDSARHRNAGGTSHSQHDDADHVVGEPDNRGVSRRGGRQSGYGIAFVFNALSFVISALCISRLRRPEGFRAVGAGKRQKTGALQYREGLSYMKSTPLVAGIVLINVGWASGGGAPETQNPKNPKNPNFVNTS